jgi:hypothetical protein
MPNDFFSNRTVLPFVSGEVLGTTYGASSDSGVPGAPADVWYEWTAPTDGLLFVNPRARLPTNSSINLYSGSSLVGLVIQTNRLGGSSLMQNWEWQVHSNMTYLLALAEPPDWQGLGDFKLGFEFRPKVKNDGFADRISLSGLRGRVEAYSTLATLESDEPSYTLYYPAVASVWWTLTPPIDGTLELLYQAEFQALQPWLGESLKSLTPLPSTSLYFFGNGYYPVKAGIPLQISLARSADDQFVPWSWQILPPPQNDNFASRTKITVQHGTMTGTTKGASPEPGEPTVVGHLSTWWSYVPDYSGFLSVTVTNSHLAFERLQIGAFTGSALPELKRIASGDNLRFQVRRGETYQLFVASGYPPGADYSLTVELLPFAHIVANIDDTGALLLKAVGLESAIIETSDNWTTWEPVQDVPVASQTWRIPIKDERIRLFRLRSAGVPN